MISKATLGRLPEYLKYLRTLPLSHAEISATAMARELALGEVQVRKDLASVCGNGKPKVGYRVSELTACMTDILSGTTPREAVIVGAGKLGAALLDFSGFSEYGISVRKAFDADSSKCGQNILPLDELHSYCSQHRIWLGILTVPPAAAQEAVDEMIRSGIRAVWCFSASHLRVPDGVTVQYEDLALSLAHLQNRIEQEVIL